MFIIATLRDTVRIIPGQFNLKLSESIWDEINRKLANKVLLNVGLCITLESIIHLNDSIILPGDGASHTEVLFRFIVFRPSIGDVLTGKIRSCNREGVYVTLGFFDDIFVPAAALQHPSRFEEAEQAWVWEYPLESGEKHDLYMDIGEPIKFRVTGEIFAENSPICPPTIDQGHSGNKDVKTPYKIMAVINESGLGVLSWWDSNDLHGTENEEEELEVSDERSFLEGDEGEACEE